MICKQCGETMKRFGICQYCGCDNRYNNDEIPEHLKEIHHFMAVRNVNTDINKKMNSKAAEGYTYQNTKLNADVNPDLNQNYMEGSEQLWSQMQNSYYNPMMHEDDEELSEDMMRKYKGMKTALIVVSCVLCIFVGFAAGDVYGNMSSRHYFSDLKQEKEDAILEAGRLESEAEELQSQAESLQEKLEKLESEAEAQKITEESAEADQSKAYGESSSAMETEETGSTGTNSWQSQVKESDEYEETEETKETDEINQTGLSDETQETDSTDVEGDYIPQSMGNPRESKSIYN